MIRNTTLLLRGLLVRAVSAILIARIIAVGVRIFGIREFLGLILLVALFITITSPFILLFILSFCIGVCFIRPFSLYAS